MPRLPQVPFPIVIECSSDKRVDETRRLAVLESLANCHVPISPERVVLGHSEAEGLYGQEAPGVARGMFSNSSGGQGAGAMGGAASTRRWAEHQRPAAAVSAAASDSARTDVGWVGERAPPMMAISGGLAALDPPTI